MRQVLSCLLIVVLLVGLALVSGPARAGNCYPAQQSYYQPYYPPQTYAPAYQAPAYVAPTYQAPVYQQQYQVPYPYPVKAYYNPDYYWSNQDYYRDRLLVDAMAGRVQQLVGNANAGTSGQFEVRDGKILLTKDQLAQLLQEARSGQTAPVQPQQQQPQVKPVTPMTGASAGWYSGPGSGTPTDQRLTALVQANCISCHGGSNPARMNLTNLDALTVEARSFMWAEVNDNLMPKNGKPLADGDEKLFRENWRGALAVARR